MLKLPAKGYALKHKDGRVSLESFKPDAGSPWHSISKYDRISADEKAQAIENGVTVVKVEIREVKKKARV